MAQPWMDGVRTVTAGTQPYSESFDTAPQISRVRNFIRRRARGGESWQTSPVGEHVGESEVGLPTLQSHIAQRRVLKPTTCDATCWAQYQHHGATNNRGRVLPT